MTILNDNEASCRLIVVLGMHRSGTSAITRGLSTMGVELGDTLIPPKSGENDKGFWEDKDVLGFNDSALGACGLSWHSLAPLTENNVEFLCNSNYFNRAVELLREKTEGRPCFGVKDPRIPKLLPFWLRVFSALKIDAKFILQLRNPVSVAKSLEKRNGFRREKSYLLWLEHVLNPLRHIDEQDVVVVDYDRLLNAPKNELRRIAEKFELVISEPDLSVYCDEFLERGLRHHQSDFDQIDADAAAPGITRSAYEYLYNVSAGSSGYSYAEAAEKAKGWLAEFHDLEPLLRMSDEQDGMLAEPLKQGTKGRPKLATQAQMFLEYTEEPGGGVIHFDESHSIKTAYMVDGRPQSFQFPLPDNLCELMQLRLDVAGCPAVIVLHAMSLVAPDGAVLWAWDGEVGAIEKIAGLFPVNQGHGLSMVSITDDPQFVLSIPEDVRQHVKGGSVLHVEMTAAPLLEGLPQVLALVDARRQPVDDMEAEMEEIARLVRSKCRSWIDDRAG